VSEIIEDGKTGIVVQSKDEAIRKLPHLLTLDRRRIRHEFERRFFRLSEWLMITLDCIKSF
jgi:hypothetical protein